jgi:hypothetical protein
MLALRRPLRRWPLWTLVRGMDARRYRRWSISARDVARNRSINLIECLAHENEDVEQPTFA